MQGANEDLPEEIGDSLPGYEAWPSGYTIGPIDKLKTASKQEQISYLLTTLPKCRQQFWITPQVLQIYEQLLKQQNLQGVLNRVAGDLKNNRITHEVFAIIEGMKIS